MVNGATIAVLAGIGLFGVVAVPPLLHNVDTGANIIDQLFDVNSTNSTDNDILIFTNGTWISANITQFLENTTKGHINVGGGAEVFKDENSTDARFRTLVDGGGVSITQNEDTILITTGGGGGPPALQAIAKGNPNNIVYNATTDGNLLTVIGDGIAINQTNSILFSINATVGRLNDVNVTDVDQNQFLIYNATSQAFENKPISRLLLLKDVFFNAEEATVDDLTGVDCVNDITYNFFDNTDPHEYARQVVEFCPDADPDDNLTWLYVVPSYYEERDFNFKLFWSDDDSSSAAYMATSTNDCEEDTTDGVVDCGSSDLELHDESPSFSDGIVGLRYTGVTVPNAATILSANIQFHVDEVSTGTVEVVFHGEDVDDSAALAEVNSDLSNRVNTTASVNWDIPSWPTVSAEGADQLSPDLTSIVQEIVDRGGWVSGNDMTFLINEWPDNTGERTAESFNGEAGNQPELTITYSLGGESPVCFEIAVMPLANTQVLDGLYIGQQTVCVNRSGLDNLSITEFIVPSTDHQFAAEDLVFIKIHRPDDFVGGDFEQDVYVLGGLLEWID